MQTVYIIDVARSAVGKYCGALSTIRPDDLLATIIKKLLARNPNIDVNTIDEVIAGAANQSGEDNRNVARMAALLAGLPVTVSGNTVNRLCASGLQAIMDASRQIACGDAEIMIACGVESMTRAPFVMGKATSAYSRNTELYDTTIGWRFTNPAMAALYHPYPMGETAENVAKQYNISRLAQDEFAFASQTKYAAAQAAGYFKNEILDVEILGTKTDAIMFNIDEHPRLSSLEKLGQLKPAFAANGSVTAGNSSGINDGAAAMILASEAAVKKYNLTPMARIVSMGTAGVHPSIMGVGPVPATQKALQKAGLHIKQLNNIELNEAFASQALACIKELNINPEIINLQGGSIAIGHPLGASGVRISATLLHSMKRNNNKLGLATMCVGLGQGASVIYEKC
jgi:3-oxoadipyl-CoA thiolase